MTVSIQTHKHWDNEKTHWTIATLLRKVSFPGFGQGAFGFPKLADGSVHALWEILLSIS